MSAAMYDDRNFLRSVIAVAGRRPRVWFAQFFGNAALFALFYGWLRIPDRNGWQFAASLLLGIVVAIGAIALHGGTLVYFRRAHRGDVAEPAYLRNGVIRALSNWFALTAWFGIFFCALWLVLCWWDNNAQLAGWLRHLLPDSLRRGVSVRFIDAHLDQMAWLCVWVLVPLILLPLVAQVATWGWRGYVRRLTLRALASGRYWLLAIVLLLIGGPLPAWIARHAASPESSFSVQIASMIVRFLLAYVILVTAWVVFCSLLGWFGNDGAPGARLKPEHSEPPDLVGVREPVAASPPRRRAGAEADLE